MDTTFYLADALDKERWSGIFWVLAWGFAIAALVWWIIWWLLFGADDDGIATGEDTTSSSATEAKSPESSTTDADDASAAVSATGAATATGAAASVKTSADVSAAEQPSTEDDNSDSAEDDSASAETETDSSATGDADANATEAPAVDPDDFVALGLAGGTSSVMNAEGTLTYEQIADWSGDDIATAKAKFGEANPDVDFDELPWKANALANGVDLDSISTDDPAYGAPHKAPETVDHDNVIASNFKDEDVRNDDDLGVVYNKGAVAGHVDNLREIKGVGPKLSNELNEYGVYCYKQIANWSDHNVAEFSERLNCFKNRIERDRWIPQAASLECSDLPGIDTASEDEAKGAFADDLSSGKAQFDETYGIVYSSEPDEVDDLKQVKGIAKVLEGKLHGIGVYKFKQIAFWTDAACKEFSKLLTFKDRIYRDNWIAQAKEFHEKKYGEKL